MSKGFADGMASRTIGAMPMQRFTHDGVDYIIRWGTQTVGISQNILGRGGSTVTLPQDMWEKLKAVDTKALMSIRRQRPIADEDDDDDDDDEIGGSDVILQLQRLSTGMPARPEERILKLGPVLIFNEGWRQGIKQALSMIYGPQPCGGTINDWHQRVRCDLKRGHEGMHSHAKDHGERILQWNDNAPTASVSYPTGPVRKTLVDERVEEIADLIEETLDYLNGAAPPRINLQIKAVLQRRLSTAQRLIGSLQR